MELKGTKDWSDYDGTDGERKSIELPKPSPERVPDPQERRSRLFDLGIIYNRRNRDMPHEDLKPVSEERDHVQPELAHGVSLGTPERSGITATGPNVDQIAQVERDKAAAHKYEDDESDEESSDVVTDTQNREQPAPPVEDLPDIITPPLTQEKADQAHFVPPTEAYTPPQAIEPTPPSAEDEPVVYAPQSTDSVPPLPPVPSTAGGSGGNRVPPPPPPGGPGNAYPGPNNWPSYNAGPQTQWGGGPNVPPSASYRYNLLANNTANLLTQRAFESAQDVLRRQMVARMIVVAALTWYFARRPIKPLRKQVAELEKTTLEQNEQIAKLTTEQQAAQERLLEQQRQIEQFTKPGASTFEQQAAAVFNAQHRLRQSGEQPPAVRETEQSAAVASGLYGAPNGRHETTAPNAPYAEAYQPNTIPERRPGQFGLGDRFVGGGAGFGGPMTSGSSSMPSGGLSDQFTAQDSNHLPEAPQPNPVVSAISSPWLWLGVGILIIAFFAAATI